MRTQAENMRFAMRIIGQHQSYDNNIKTGNPMERKEYTMKKALPLLFAVCMTMLLSACYTERDIKEARSSGYNKGYDDGYTSGFDTEFDAGYNRGYTKGHD